MAGVEPLARGEGRCLLNAYRIVPPAESPAARLTEREEKLLHRLAVAGRMVVPESPDDVSAGYRLWALGLASKSDHGGAAVTITDLGRDRAAKLATARRARS